MVSAPKFQGARLSLKGIAHSYGKEKVLSGISADVHAGEFFSILGPSGCGKTTLLRLIAGFEKPHAGEIWLDDKLLTRLPPEKRPVNTVFQHYALFPHLTVLQNVLYPLQFDKKLSKEERRERADKLLSLTRMTPFSDKLPENLSGGQRQRTALARALAGNPRLLLLDEPLSALDAKLRKDMLLELQEIHRSTGLTFIFVTHDQEEALGVSNRILLLNKGKIEQLGTSHELYNTPSGIFTASFIGETNLLRVNKNESKITLAGYATIALPNNVHLFQHEDYWYTSIRPSRCKLGLDREKMGIPVIVRDIIFQGTYYRIHLMEMGSSQVFICEMPTGAFIPHVGQEVYISLEM